jgi:hypothetical protein
LVPSSDMLCNTFADADDSVLKRKIIENIAFPKYNDSGCIHVFLCSVCMLYVVYVQGERESGRDR